MVNSDPLLFIVILNWIRPSETLSCLKSVFNSEYPNFRVVVVDNGSRGGSLQEIKKSYPSAKIIQNSTNLGYAEGNNIGIRYACQQGAEYILLLNDDVLVKEDTFIQLVSAAEKNRNVAAVGCKVVLFTDPTRLWAIGEGTSRGKPFPVDNGSYDTKREIDYAVGCCILLCKRALDTIGLLNSDYFAVHEEREWCLRARRAGYSILYMPKAIVTHKISQSLTSQWSPMYHYLYVRNRLLLLTAEGQRPQDWRRLRGALWVWWQEVKFINRHGGGKPGRMWWGFWGALDFFRGRIGLPPERLAG
jgi:GT2 family glycosyltransferase